MSESIWVNGTNDLVGTTTCYLPLFGCRASKFVTPPLTWYKTIVAIPYTVDRLRVSLSAAPGAGESRTLTIHGGAAGGTGSDQTVTCTISDTDTEGQDLVHNVTGIAGTWLCLKCEASAGAASARIRFSVRCDGDNADETLLAWIGDTGGFDNSLDRYAGFGGASLWSGSTGIGEVQTVLPCPGTVSDLYAEISAAPGDWHGNEHSREFTAYKNGASQSLTCTISGSNKTANDTSNSFSVAAGDRVHWLCHPVSGGGSQWPATARGSISACFTPSTSGQFIIPSASDEPAQDGTYDYRQACGGVLAMDATEANVYALAQGLKITRMQVLLDGAPWTSDDGRGYGIGLRQNGGGAAHICQVLGTNTACYDEDEDIYKDDDLIDVRAIAIIIPGPPAKRHAAISLLAEVYEGVRHDAAMMSLF